MYLFYCGITTYQKINFAQSKLQIFANIWARKFETQLDSLFFVHIFWVIQQHSFMFDPTERLPLQQTQINFGLLEVVWYGQSFHRLKTLKKATCMDFFSYAYFCFLFLPAQMFRRSLNDFFINIVFSGQMQRFRGFDCKARKYFFPCYDKQNYSLYSLLIFECKICW